MAASISVDEKKQFVRWFLESYKLKRRECIWILNYMLSNDTLLTRTHFVEQAHYCPRAMMMSSVESEEAPFRFYKGSLMTADAERSFHELRLNPEEELYVQLNFPSYPPSPLYMSVLEENPYEPTDAVQLKKDELVAERIMEESIMAFQEELLAKQIDEALDAGDRERFLMLTRALTAFVSKKEMECD